MSSAPLPMPQGAAALLGPPAEGAADSQFYAGAGTAPAAALYAADDVKPAPMAPQAMMQGPLPTQSMHGATPLPMPVQSTQHSPVSSTQSMRLAPPVFANEAPRFSTAAQSMGPTYPPNQSMQVSAAPMPASPVPASPVPASPVPASVQLLQQPMQQYSVSPTQSVQLVPPVPNQPAQSPAAVQSVTPSYFPDQSVRMPASPVPTSVQPMQPGPRIQYQPASSQSQQYVVPAQSASQPAPQALSCTQMTPPDMGKGDAALYGYEMKPSIAHNSTDSLLTGVWNFFPTLFSIMCFVLFVIPIWLTCDIGRDASVRYWITRFAWVALLLPFLYLGTHIYHVVYRRANKVLILACLLGSCLLLLVLGDIILMKAYYRSNEFAANDCQSFGAKRDLEMQYQNAKMFYSQCVTGMANKTSVSLQAAVSIYRIEDCFGYTAQLRTNPGWTYLGRLENEYSCGGWCAQDQPLWTLKIVKDSCSSAVADILKDKVLWSMTQVVIYSLIVFGFVAALLLTASPFFSKFGIGW